MESETLGLDILLGWPETGPKIFLTQAVPLFNSRGTIAFIQKAGRDIEADQAKANKAVVKALDTVAKWVAKLPPVEVSPALEVEAIPRHQRPQRQGTKRRAGAAQIDLVEAQILGEFEAI